MRTGRRLVVVTPAEAQWTLYTAKSSLAFLPFSSLASKATAALNFSNIHAE